MEQCEVLIVGGGPAGATCAWKLRQAGVDVVVLDKKTFPRDKVCAGWITPAVIEELQLDTEDYRCGRVFQPITGFAVGRIDSDADAVTTHYGRPVSYGIRRCEFDHYLLQRCAARLHLGTGLETLRRDGGTWVVNDSIRTKLVVGAGGHFCPVARFLGARLGATEHAIAAQEVEFELDADQLRECRVEPQVPELYFCSDLRGYGWCIRKGNFLNVGLGREDNHRLSDQSAALWQWLQRRVHLPQGQPMPFKGHAYLLYSDAVRRLADDGVMAIGDAAGLAYPRSGEGIRPAVESALLAAATILEAAGDYRGDKLEAYGERLRARFGRRAAGNGASDLLPPKLKQMAAERLLAMPWFARHVVLDRWFLHTQQAPLTRTDPSLGSLAAAH